MKIGKKTAILSPELRGRQASAGTTIPDERELRAALGSIPDEIDWEWARPRIVPLFERGGAEGTASDPMINAVTSLGVGIGFGIDLGMMFARVTKSMGERWEASVEQIERVAFENLAKAVATLDRRDLQRAVFNGHVLHALPNPPGWASSVILAGEAEIMRIFGDHDQVFTTPARPALLSFDARTPKRAIVDATLAFEEMDDHPLLIDPFVLEGGRLSWSGFFEDEGE